MKNYFIWLTLYEILRNIHTYKLAYLQYCTFKIIYINSQLINIAEPPFFCNELLHFDSNRFQIYFYYDSGDIPKIVISVCCLFGPSRLLLKMNYRNLDMYLICFLVRLYIKDATIFWLFFLLNLVSLETVSWKLT